MEVGKASSRPLLTLLCLCSPYVQNRNTVYLCKAKLQADFENFFSKRYATTVQIGVTPVLTYLVMSHRGPYITIKRSATLSSSYNASLVLGAVLSAAAAVLHFACLIWGAPLFRFLGAGEPIAQMAEKGHWYANFIAFAIGTLLAVWAAYALSGAGLFMRLPFVRLVLGAITGIYLLRAVAFPLLRPAFPENSDTFWLVTSGICLVIGSVHLTGLLQVWGQL